MNLNVTYLKIIQISWTKGCAGRKIIRQGTPWDGAVVYQTQIYRKKENHPYKYKGNYSIYENWNNYWFNYSFEEYNGCGRQIFIMVSFFFQIHKITEILRSKSNWNESRISKSSLEKEWFVNSDWLLIEDFIGLFNL